MPGIRSDFEQVIQVISIANYNVFFSYDIALFNTASAHFRRDTKLKHINYYMHYANTCTIDKVWNIIPAQKYEPIWAQTRFGRLTFLIEEDISIVISRGIKRLNVKMWNRVNPLFYQIS